MPSPGSRPRSSRITGCISEARFSQKTTMKTGISEIDPCGLLLALCQLAEVFRDTFKRSRRLIPMSGYYEWQNTPGGKHPWYFTDLRWLAASHGRWALGRMERPRDGREVEVLHDDSDRAQRVRCGNPRPHASVFDEGSIRAVAKRQGGLLNI